ncbi:MAG: hypothetical protein ABIQ47_01095 [Tepidiformaceae bacterium]
MKAVFDVIGVRLSLLKCLRFGIVGRTPAKPLLGTEIGGLYLRRSMTHEGTSVPPRTGRRSGCPSRTISTEEKERDRQRQHNPTVDPEVDHQVTERLVLDLAERCLRADGEDAPGGGNDADMEKRLP